MSTEPSAQTYLAANIEDPHLLISFAPRCLLAETHPQHPGGTRRRYAQHRGSLAVIHRVQTAVGRSTAK